MTNIFIKSILTKVSLFFCFFITLAINISYAHEYTGENLFIDHPWARATAPVAANGAAYLIVTNNGESSRTLTSISGDIAEKIELHMHEEVDGAMKMIEIEDGIEIGASESLTFAPGDMHIMLLGLKQPLMDGEKFPLTLHFENGESVEVVVNVQKQDEESQHHNHNASSDKKMNHDEHKMEEEKTAHDH